MPRSELPAVYRRSCIPDFAPVQRVPFVLLLDTSGSMLGDGSGDPRPIDELNAGIQELVLQLPEDELVRYSADVAIVTFGHEVKLVSDFRTVDELCQLNMAPLSADGSETHMGAAVRQGLSLIDRQLALYRDQGRMNFKPWLWLITDGQPYGERPEETHRAFAECFRRQGLRTRDGGIVCTAITVGEAQGAAATAALKSLTKMILPLRGADFRRLFRVLVSLARQVSMSQPDDAIDVRSTEGFDDAFCVRPGS
jgi:uncharacterized protein YegL